MNHFYNFIYKNVIRQFRVNCPIYIYIYLQEGHGKRSINRASGFNGEAVLSLAVRYNKDESSCKVYACWKLHENFVSIFCFLSEMHPTSLPGAVRVNALRHLWHDSVNNRSSPPTDLWQDSDPPPPKTTQA